jgi:hypothetical protein
MWFIIVLDKGQKAPKGFFVISQNGAPSCKGGGMRGGIIDYKKHQ